MGSGGSTHFLPASDERLLKSIKILDLSNLDLAKIFALFNKHDKAQRGYLTLSTVYNLLGERRTIFGDSLFELIGVQDFQKLTFSEWLHAVTTFCLFEEEDILKFCFFILDREKNGYIDREDMRILVSMLYHVDPVKGPTGNTNMAVDKLSIQQDGKIEFWEFELFNRVFPSLFFPAFRLQVKMMQAVLGERWWKRKKRQLQDEVDNIRRLEEKNRTAEANRLEAMRQRRIRRKMGKYKYYLWPCGREAYDEMFPKPKVPVVDPEQEEAERLQKEAEARAELQRRTEARNMNPETEEFKRYREKVDAKREKQSKHNDESPSHARRPVEWEQNAHDRRLRLENRRAKIGRMPVVERGFS